MRVRFGRGLRGWRGRIRGWWCGGGGCCIRRGCRRGRPLWRRAIGGNCRVCRGLEAGWNGKERGVSLIDGFWAVFGDVCVVEGVDEGLVFWSRVDVSVVVSPSKSVHFPCQAWTTSLPQSSDNNSFFFPSFSQRPLTAMASNSSRNITITSSTAIVPTVTFGTPLALLYCNRCSNDSNPRPSFQTDSALQKHILSYHEDTYRQGYPLSQQRHPPS